MAYGHATIVNKRATRLGFTIVELLIVVVVIAILAAITIVAFNGVQNRAKTSAIQNAAAQASRKVMSYAVENSDQYPADLAAFLAATKLTNAGTTTYQYSANNTLPRSFCVTATSSGISYYSSNTANAPAAGACPGHGANGAVPITNLVENPSVETASTGWALHAGLTPSGTGGRIQVSGKWVMQGTRNVVGATAIYISQNLPSTVTASTDYTGSAVITSTASQTVSLQVRIAGTATSIFSTSVGLTANVPFRVVTTGNVGANTSVFLTVLSSAGTVGDVLTVDEAMLTAGTTVYTYADGSSTNWAWDGAVGTSTSTGPPL